MLSLATEMPEEHWEKLKSFDKVSGIPQGFFTDPSPSLWVGVVLPISLGLSVALFSTAWVMPGPWTLVGEVPHSVLLPDASRSPGKPDYSIERSKASNRKCLRMCKVSLGLLPWIIIS